MSSEIVTAVEVGRSLYIYTGDKLVTSLLTNAEAIGQAVLAVRANSEEFRHVRVSHLDWDTLLEWEDRVEKSSLRGLLDSTWNRRLTVTHLQPARV
jgi:hypothetical protein